MQRDTVTAPEDFEWLIEEVRRLRYELARVPHHCRGDVGDGLHPAFAPFSGYRSATNPRSELKPGGDCRVIGRPEAIEHQESESFGVRGVDIVPQEDQVDPFRERRRQNQRVWVLAVQWPGEARFSRIGGSPCVACACPLHFLDPELESQGHRRVGSSALRT